MNIRLAPEDFIIDSGKYVFENFRRLFQSLFLLRHTVHSRRGAQPQAG